MSLIDFITRRALPSTVSEGPYALNEDDRRRATRQGLLQAGLATLAAPGQAGPAAAISTGLLAGLQGARAEAEGTQNDRYRADMMARTRQGMERNAQLEQAMTGLINEDGSINQERWLQFARVSPLEAIQFRQQMQAATQRQPGETRERIVGNEQIQEEWDPQEGVWREIGRGGRWSPNSGASMFGMPRPPAGYQWAPDGSLAFIPGGPADPATRASGAPTEDERKAAGWYAQASTAFQNMEAAIAEDANAARPSVTELMRGQVPVVGEWLANEARSEPRQRFVQASDSFAEAALRAATGAGVNENEARQKVAELTPQLGDGPQVIQQKREGLRVYLQSLEQRAGRALPAGAQAPAAAPAPAGAPSFAPPTAAAPPAPAAPAAPAATATPPRSRYGF